MAPGFTHRPHRSLHGRPRTTFCGPPSSTASPNSIPIIVGDKVFTLAEPGTLVCIDRNNGSILWQRENKLEDLAEPAEVDKIAEAHKQAREWRQAIGKANGQMWKAKQDLQDKPEDEALKAKIKELEEQVKGLQEKLKPYEESW